MHLLDENFEASVDPDFDTWYDTLTDEDVCGILAQYEESELFDLFLILQAESMPQDWRDQILRAYNVFGTNTVPAEFSDLEGLNEFDIFGKLSKTFLSEKAKKQIRDQFGRWRDEVVGVGTEIFDARNKRREVRGKIATVKDTGDVARQDIDPIGLPPVEGLKDIEKVKESIARRAEQVHQADYMKGRRFGKGTADDPIAVGNDLDRAVRLILDGKHVRLNDDEKFRTFIDKVGEMANLPENQEKGFNLCLASVPNTSLFCKIHKGLRRVKMPQAEGIPDNSTPADAISEFKDGKKKKVDLLPELKNKLLNGLGYDMKDTEIKASHLASAQSEIDGRIIGNDKKVLRAQQKEAKRRLEEKLKDPLVNDAAKAEIQDLYNKMYGDPAVPGDRGDTNLRHRYSALQEWDTEGNYQAGPDKQTTLLDNFIKNGSDKSLEELVVDATPPSRIMVTRDGYIIDGHHRYAAQLAMDAEDGIVGDYDMPVTMVDAEIGEMLDLITAYTEMVGIPPNIVGHDPRTDAEKKADTTKRMVDAEARLRTIIAARTKALGEEMSPEQIDDFIAKLKFIRKPADKDERTSYASDLHEAWRAPRKQADGSFEPRMKDDGKGGEVDIANTPYDDLPPKWQAENRDASGSAYNRIWEVEQSSTKDFDPDDPEQMEAVADGIHQDWLKRNGEWAEPQQKLDYKDLSEEEKQKDRDMARAAFKKRKRRTT